MFLLQYIWVKCSTSALLADHMCVGFLDYWSQVMLHLLSHHQQSLADSLWACFNFLHRIFPHNLRVNPKGLTAERGWEGARVVAWPQVDFSERLQSCLIPSSHGNRRLWCTWPTYVLYVHKHTLTICYCCFVHRLVGTLSDCQMSLWEITRTIREARSCFHHFWEAVNALRQQWLQVTLRQAALCVYNRHCKRMRILLWICWHIICEKMAIPPI